MISAARAAHTRWLWAQAFCKTKNTSLSVSYFHLAVWWRPQTGAQWRAGFFFWAAFRLANRSQAKVGLLRGRCSLRTRAKRAGTKPSASRPRSTSNDDCATNTARTEFAPCTAYLLFLQFGRIFVHDPENDVIDLYLWKE